MMQHDNIVIGPLPLMDPNSAPGQARASMAVHEAMANAHNANALPSELVAIVDATIRNSQTHNDTLIVKVTKEYANYFGIAKKRDLVTYIRLNDDFIEGTHYHDTSLTGMQVIGPGHILLIHRKAPAAALDYINTLLRTIVRVKDLMQATWNAANPSAAEVAQITSPDHIETGHLIEVTHHAREALADVAYGPASGPRTAWVVAAIGRIIFPKLDGQAGSAGFAAASVRSGRDPCFRKDPAKRAIAQAASKKNSAFRAGKSFAASGARHALVASDLVNLRIAEASPAIVAEANPNERKRMFHNAVDQGMAVVGAMYNGASDTHKRRLFFPTTQQGWEAIGHGTSTVNSKRAKHHHGYPQLQGPVVEAQAAVASLLGLPAP